MLIKQLVQVVFLTRNLGNTSCFNFIELCQIRKMNLIKIQKISLFKCIRWTDFICQMWLVLTRTIRKMREVFRPPLTEKINTNLYFIYSNPIDNASNKYKKNKSFEFTDCEVSFLVSVTFIHSSVSHFNSKAVILTLFVPGGGPRRPPITEKLPKNLIFRF